MKKSFFFALALMLVMGIGGLVYDASAAQNTNSSTTMSNMGNMGSKRNMGGRRHRRGRRHGRRHRRGRRGKNKNANM